MVFVSIFLLLSLSPLMAGCPEADFGPLPFPSFGGSVLAIANGVPVYVADFDRDRHLDVLLVGPTSAAVFRGNGDGTFKARTDAATQPIFAAVVGDLNRDGNPDLAIAPGTGAAGNIRVLLGNGAGAFGISQSYRISGSPGTVAYHIGIGDVNKDGNLDVITGNNSPLSVSVFLGAGDGTLSLVSSNAVHFSHGSVAVADFDGDGIDDVAFGGQMNNSPQGAPALGVLLSNGDGTLRAPVFTACGSLFPAGGAWRTADLDGNGMADLVAIRSAKVCIAFSSGKGLFSRIVTFDTPAGVYDACVGDFDKDGLLDVAATSSAETTLLAGNGDGTFSSPLAFSPGVGNSRVAIGDFNEDGRTDLAVRAGGNITLLPNRTPDLPPIPVLEVVQDGRDSLVRWYDRYPGYVLESTDTLAGPITLWTEVPDGFERVRCWNVFRSRLAANDTRGRYFRLVKRGQADGRGER